MAYYLPAFNVPFDFWLPGNTPATNPPDGLIKGQLYIGSKTITAVFAPNASNIRIQVTDLFTWGPTITNAIFGFTDIIGDQWFYKVISWEFTHLGFPNEYVTLLVYQCSPTGAVPDPSR